MKANILNNAICESYNSSWLTFLTVFHDEFYVKLIQFYVKVYVKVLFMTYKRFIVINALVS